MIKKTSEHIRFAPTKYEQLLLLSFECVKDEQGQRLLIRQGMIEKLLTAEETREFIIWISEAFVPKRLDIALKNGSLREDKH